MCHARLYRVQNKQKNFAENASLCIGTYRFAKFEFFLLTPSKVIRRLLTKVTELYGNPVYFLVTGEGYHIFVIG